VRLKNVLENVEALVSFPVCGLGGDDLNPWRRLDGIAEAFQTGVARLMTWNSFQYGDLAFCRPVFFAMNSPASLPPS